MRLSQGLNLHSVPSKNLMKCGPSGKDEENFRENEDSKENNLHGLFRRNRTYLWHLGFRLKIRKFPNN